LLELFTKIGGEVEASGKHITLTEDRVEFEHVDINTPDEELLLVKDLSMKIIPGLHTLIMGANGSGKSSIFRALARLWPVQAGTPRNPVFLLVLLDKTNCLMFIRSHFQAPKYLRRPSTSLFPNWKLKRASYLPR